LATGFCRKIFNGRGEKMKATDFEDKVWEIEGIRIVLRCPPNTEVSGYDYKNAADQNSSVSEWLKGRVLPKINDISVDVIAGNGEQPHGRSLLRTVRSSYAKD
jgi:hypothetical protein